VDEVGWYTDREDSQVGFRKEQRKSRGQKQYFGIMLGA